MPVAAHGLSVSKTCPLCRAWQLAGSGEPLPCSRFNFQCFVADKRKKRPSKWQQQDGRGWNRWSWSYVDYPIEENLPSRLHIKDAEAPSALANPNRNYMLFTTNEGNFYFPEIHRDLSNIVSGKCCSKTRQGQKGKSKVSCILITPLSSPTCSQRFGHSKFCRVTAGCQQDSLLKPISW